MNSFNLSFFPSPPLRTVLTVCAASYAAFQVVTILASLVPLMRTNPSPVARRLIKTSKVKTKPLPRGVRRIYAGKPLNGQDCRIIEDDDESKWEYKIEILTNAGNNGPQNSPHLAPLVLLHGGMGSARCYDRWMEYLAAQGAREVFSISLRGHGNSTRPPYFTHLGKGAFAEDLHTALVAISHYLNASPDSTSERPHPVLIGHSAGGGLSQYYCSSPSFNPRLSALILIAPFPPSGGAPTFRNWVAFDRWFSLRFIWEGCDPMSAFGRPDLVKRAFFHDRKPLTRDDVHGEKGEESVQEFFEQMNPEENGAWSMSMMFKFADVARVKASVHDKVHLITASHDRLMTPDIMSRVQKMYECEMDVVHDSGHHIMFDTHWEDGLRFLEARLTKWGL
ncbi:hypothetical protein D9758_010286 [Tetrapyrgos nigripes]|uniref:AB hydrolase-1 domain-containing protein n=1 Tax=Tetrapyrgos nigripes TaxID=182062 RepID=A0A8H5GAG3_9AGAR|nr:hypothetical protein D9758_010286 [Tetrapyrgos nigripes]